MDMSRSRASSRFEEESIVGAYDDGMAAARRQAFCSCKRCLASLHGYLAYQAHAYLSGFYNERLRSDPLNAIWSIAPENCPECLIHFDSCDYALIPGSLMCLDCQCLAVLAPLHASAFHIKVWSEAGGACVVCCRSERYLKRRK